MPSLVTVKNTLSNNLSLALLACLFLNACGGSSSSGSDSDTNTADIAGVYEGEETLSLTRSADSVGVERITNSVIIRIQDDGVLRYSAANGTSGTTRIFGNNQFELQADARTQFNGTCSSGRVVLNGQVTSFTKITATYRSENLICKNQSHTITGTANANR